MFCGRVGSDDEIDDINLVEASDSVRGDGFAGDGDVNAIARSGAGPDSDANFSVVGRFTGSCLCIFDGRMDFVGCLVSLSFDCPLVPTG